MTDTHTDGRPRKGCSRLAHIIITTEAGWLPYDSKWRTLYPFGLTNKHVIHEGLSDAYLDQVNPDLVMYHDVVNPYTPRWKPMVDHLHDYCEARGPTDLHVYYVPPEPPDAQGLVFAITNHLDKPFTRRMPTPRP
jgi:hypothetical protein